jgi:ABC-type sugar transport system, periplasmic component
MASFFLTVACACSSQTDKTADISEIESSTESAAETEPEYVYPEEDYSGASFTVLNSDEIWDFYVALDFDGLDGESLNDAVYNRNRDVEQKLNCKIEVTKLAYDSLINTASSLIMAGDSEYDVMYLPVNHKPGMISDHDFVDLNTLPQLNLDSVWWDGAVIKSSQIDGKLYFATSDLHLMAFDGSWCLFFNQDMMTNYNLDMPYSLVKSGGWTLDKLLEYSTAVANLNGDESYKWSSSGNCVYGISAHEATGPDYFVYGCSGRYVTASDGGFTITATDENFTSTVSKLAEILKDGDGITIKASNEDFDQNAGGYIYIFSVGRALFLTAPLKNAQLLRNMDTTFGIIPFPKYDESQSDYNTMVDVNLLFLTIPVTNKKLEQTATILDVLSYESYKQTLPYYYDVTVSQKGLRNEESIEMLDIIRSTRGIDVSIVFGWSADLRTEIRKKIYAGDGAVVSTITKYSDVLSADIDEMVTALKQQS